MQTKHPLFDDLAKLATGAAGAVHGMKGEVEDMAKAWLERKLADMDLVTREEFEAVRLMAQKAREENEQLRAEIDSIKGNSV